MRLLPHKRFPLNFFLLLAYTSFVHVFLSMGWETPTRVSILIHILFCIGKKPYPLLSFVFIMMLMQLCLVFLLLLLLFLVFVLLTVLLLSHMSHMLWCCYKKFCWFCCWLFLFHGCCCFLFCPWFYRPFRFYCLCWFFTYIPTFNYFAVPKLSVSTFMILF